MATTRIITTRNTVSERGGVPKYKVQYTPVYAKKNVYNDETQRWEIVDDITNVLKHDRTYVLNPDYNHEEIWSHPDNNKNNVTETESVVTEIEETNYGPVVEEEAPAEPSEESGNEPPAENV